MKTDVISGLFDVRKYEKKVERKDRKLLAENDNISFSASFPINELPDVFKIDGAPDVFVKLYASRDEVRAAEAERREAVNDRASVKFKIGSGTKWFDKYGKAVSKPSNEELDGDRYEVRIDFKRRAKNPDDDKAPSGYWANAIMFRKLDANPFAGEAFEEQPEDDPEPAQAPEPAAAQEGGEGKLPF